MLDFLKDLWGYLKTRKKYWLVPLILTLLALGALVLLAETSAVAPFLYPFF